MSAYTTKFISRERAIELWTKVLVKLLDTSTISSPKLEELLNEYAYTGDYTDILGVLYNFRIEN